MCVCVRVCVSDWPSFCNQGLFECCTTLKDSVICCSLGGIVTPIALLWPKTHCSDYYVCAERKFSSGPEFESAFREIGARLNPGLLRKINKSQMWKSERGGVAMNERDWARNGDGQMFAISLKSRGDVQLDLCLGPVFETLWLTLGWQKKKRDRRTDSSKICVTLKLCVSLVTVMLDQRFRMLGYAFGWSFFFLFPFFFNPPLGLNGTFGQLHAHRRAH